MMSQPFRLFGFGSDADVDADALPCPGGDPPPWRGVGPSRGAVPVTVGVLYPPGDGDGGSDGGGKDGHPGPGPTNRERAQEVAALVARVAPDRFSVVLLPWTDDPAPLPPAVPPAVPPAAAAVDAPPPALPPVQVLVLCASMPGFPSEYAAEYVKVHRPPVVLTDLNLGALTADRAAFYDLLDGHGDRSLGGRLPFRVRSGSGSGSGGDGFAVSRREHVAVGGRIALKPCLERPLDAALDDFRVYYPASAGGGCKHLATGRFYPHDGVPGSNSDVRGSEVSAAAAEADAATGGGATGGNRGGYIYEELVADGAAEGAAETERRYRKRDRLRNMAYDWVPSLERRAGAWGGGGGFGASLPHYADDADVSPDSDLGREGRRFYVVTTASLPWMTGTAVNPLLRAAYLLRSSRAGAGAGGESSPGASSLSPPNVTLVVPWLTHEEEREKLYGKQSGFRTPADQEAHVREWLRDKAGMPAEADPATGIQFLWYAARYHPTFLSIFSACDICGLIPDADADVCVLEEPEHLNWFRREGDPWTRKFAFTVGVVHTNYKAYAGAQYGGFLAAPAIGKMSALMVRAYCNKVIKLSPVLQTFSPEKEMVCNVHGVRSEFVEEGRRRARGEKEEEEAEKEKKEVGEDGPGGSADVGSDSAVASSDGNRVYFVGKILWAKGLDKMMGLEHFYRKMTGDYFGIDIVGDGPELEDIRRAYLGRTVAQKEADGTPKKSLPKTISEFRLTPIPARFLGRQDHFEAARGNRYSIFINPSITEVLCTTTAEALSMGKFAIIPAHPSNSFFMKFPNCLPYRSKLEFAANLRWALTHDPEPLSPELSHEFTWEAATERFVDASAITMREERIRAKAKRNRIDDRIAHFHNAIAKGKRGDVVRTLGGGGPVALQSGKWKPYLEGVRRRAADAAGSTAKYGQENAALWAMAGLVTLILYLVWQHLLLGR